MTFSDWMQYFEKVDICVLPNPEVAGSSISGKITPGNNAPLDYTDFQNPNSTILDNTRHVQIKISTGSDPEVDIVWIQLLLDSHITHKSTQWVSLDLYEVNPAEVVIPPDAKAEKSQLYQLYQNYRVITNILFQIVIFYGNN